MGTPIRLQALVSEAERAAVARAGDQLSTALKGAAGASWLVDCVFPPALEAFDRSGDAVVMITSFLGEVDAFDEPWPETEARLRAVYQSLAADGRLIVFICTVLRHVAVDADPSSVMARRIRIRRLNLLAVALSQETGVFVIDVDRVLADIGARALQTDYRLEGDYAADAAGKAIAMALLAVGLDAVLPFDVQESAREALAAYQPCRVGPMLGTPVAGLVGKSMMALRSGRRTQVVATVVHENQVVSKLRRILSRQIAVRDAIEILGRSLGRRGLRGTVLVFVFGMTQILRSHARASR